MPMFDPEGLSVHKHNRGGSSVAAPALCVAKNAVLATHIGCLKTAGARKAPLSAYTGTLTAALKRC